MEIHYRREMRHNYLVIVPEQYERASYESRMMASNHIQGLLRFRISQTDGRGCFYYEITSKQPLNRMLESRSMATFELRSLVLGIAKALEQMEAYLLPEEQILLEPEYIYVEPESFQLYLCLVPGMRQDFPAAMGKLLQYLLGCVDHQDKECVVLAYGLYQESQKENFGIGDLIQLIPRNVEGKVIRTDHACAVDMQVSEISASVHKADEDLTKRTDQQMSWRERLNHTVTRFTGKSAERETPGQKSIQKVSDWEEWQELLEEPDTFAAEKETEREPMTVLLADLDEKRGGYCLKSLQPGLPDILLRNFPYIIGKHSNLADFHLEKDTVSRLHLKIDRYEDGFQVTDLNSTNGTRVRGKLLENNENVSLHFDDEIQIAEWKYRFEQI